MSSARSSWTPGSSVHSELAEGVAGSVVAASLLLCSIGSRRRRPRTACRTAIRSIEAVPKAPRRHTISQDYSAAALRSLSGRSPRDGRADGRLAVNSEEATETRQAALADTSEHSEPTDEFNSEVVEVVRDSLGIDMDQFKDAIRYAFDRFDQDGDGQLSAKEFHVAANVMGLNISQEMAEKAFRQMTGGKEYFVPAAFQTTPMERMKSAIESAIERRSEENAFDEAGYLVANFWKATTEGQLSVEDRVRAIQDWWRVNQQAGFNLLETSVDLLGTGIALASLTNILVTTEDFSQLSFGDEFPLILLLGKIFRDFSRDLEESTESNLSHDQAIVYASVFKPAGFTLNQFQIMCGNGDAKWIRLPAGATIPKATFEGRLAFVATGKIRVEVKSAVPGLSETSCNLAPGAMMGKAVQLLLGGATSQEDGKAAGPSVLSGAENESDETGQLGMANAKRAVVEEDSLVMLLDQQKLKTYLKAHSGITKKFLGVVARSMLQTTSNVRSHVRKLASEFPSLFRDLLINFKRMVGADRATLWIHDDVKAEMWTLFLFEEGELSDSKYVSMPDSMGLMGQCFTGGKSINLADCYLHPNFNKSVDKKTGYRTQSMLCMPIFANQAKPGSKPIAVLQLLNKEAARSGAPGDEKRFLPFTWKDEQVVEENSWMLALLADRLMCRYTKDRAS